MKTVTKNPKTTVPNLSGAKYYGVIVNNERGFIQRKDYSKDSYVIKVLDHLTDGNMMWKFNDQALGGLVKQLLNSGHKIFEFTDFSGLALWLEGQVRGTEVVLQSVDVGLDGVCGDKYYGVQMGSDSRGMITSNKYEDGPYKILATSEFTSGNGWSHLNKNSLKELIENCLDNHKEVFEFETFLELAKWVTDEN